MPLRLVNRVRFPYGSPNTKNPQSIGIAGFSLRINAFRHF
nr:MAG TPA: hypothetical protein [Caudoviricetes sp.]